MNALEWTSLEWYERGQAQLRNGRFVEAHDRFSYALYLEGRASGEAMIYLSGLGAGCQMTGRIADARQCYRTILDSPESSPDLKGLAEAELEATSTRSPPDDGVLTDADDEHLASLIRPVMSSYPHILKPLHAWWVADDDSSKRRISAMEDGFGVPPDGRVAAATAKFGWAALTCFPNGAEHFLLVSRDFWDDSQDIELTGMICHELAHAEVKEAFDALLPKAGTSGASFVAHERVADLVAMTRGHGGALLAYKTYLDRRSNAKADGHAPLTPAEVGYHLALIDHYESRFESAQAG